MLAASGAEPIRELRGNLLLVDRVQHHRDRSLDNLVLQRGNRQRTLSPIRLQNEPSPGWLRPIRSPMNPGRAGPRSCDQGLTRSPATSVRLLRVQHPASGHRTPSAAWGSSTWWRSAMNRSFFLSFAAFRMRSSACDTLARSCARRMRCCPAFPSAPALGSTRSASGRPESFAGFSATMARSDFSSPCIVGLRLLTFPARTSSCATGQG